MVRGHQKETTMTQSQVKLPGRKPTHRRYRVTSDGEYASWTPIGAAWLHQDGNDFIISCDTTPLQAGSSRA